MAPRHPSAVRTNGAGRVRARVLSALHVGKLRPGDRVLSVRRLAELTGVNHKTVHRAYTALAREGVLEVRPGSGTFVTERRTAARDLPPTPGLLGALENCRSQATRLGLAPKVLSRFLDICLADGLRGVSIGVVECNGEQIAMLDRDLRRSLGVVVRPILLGDLERDPVSALGAVGSVVTTDCHYSQVVDLVEPEGVPIYTVTLDPGFPRHLLQIASRNELVMAVRDPQFGRVFLRSARQVTDDVETLRRIRIVSERRVPVALVSSAPGTRLYASPLVSPAVLRGIPGHIRRVRRCWHVDPTALESLRAGLALERALQTAPIPER